MTGGEMSGTLSIPSTVAEAVAARVAQPAARVVGGGTDVVADLNRGAPATGLVVLRAIAALHEVHLGPQECRFGAMTTIAEVRVRSAAATALGQAARSLGSRQVRNQATVGGNICGGGPQRTLIPILLAYDAMAEVAGPSGTRSVALADLLAPQGVRIGGDEILTAVRYVPTAGPQRYYRVGPRNAACYATASVTLVLDESARAVRLALGGVAPTAVRAPAAETLGTNGIDWDRRLVPDGVAEAFGAVAAEAAQPVSDLAASADYRRHAVAVMARRALRHIFEEAADG